jgi:hypothetical protein
LLLILAFTFTANAQEFRGLIAGKITDPNGAVVPGSKVEVKNTETGIVSTAVTGEDGTYNFPLLPPGKYQLTVTRENFNTAVRDGIEVRVADRLTLDVQLEIGVTAPVSRNLNFVPRQFLGDNPTTDAAANTFLSTTIPNPFRNLVPGGSPFNTATTITRAQSLLQFPQFTNLWVQEYNGSNRYTSLQLQANKRFATGVTMNATYTYSNLRDKTGYLNPSDTVLEDRISEFDRPHRFTFAGVYELPIGRGRLLGNNMNRVLDAFIGGWQLNGTYEWQSGEPFLLTNNLFFPGDVSTIVSRLGDGDGQGGKFGIDRSAIDARERLS